MNEQTRKKKNVKIKERKFYKDKSSKNRVRIVKLS